MMRKATTVVFALLLLAGCGTKADAPEPEGDRIINGTNTTVLKMPNGFRNVVVSCLGTDAVFVTSRGIDETAPQPSSIFVLADAEFCKRRPK